MKENKAEVKKQGRVKVYVFPKYFLDLAVFYKVILFSTILHKL